MSEDGFLGRWARRKRDVQQGKPVAEALPPVAVKVAHAQTLTAGAGGLQTAAIPNPEQAKQAPAEAPPEVKLPTLQDVQQLTLGGDFKPFMARGVAPEVKNAAMKKLFTDPHYNIMDGLDTYIDDYSKFEPIPESMLKQMVSAKFLKLFEEEEKPPEGEPGEAAAAQAALVAANPDSDATPNVAKSTPDHNTALSARETSAQPMAACTADPPHQDPHAHDLDLRLQPDHAAQPQSVGRGTE
ncbi:MAG: DUF3306 domain-containing protein [Burkholderiaceae bacterium]